MVVRFPCFMTQAEKEVARIAAQRDEQDDTSVLLVGGGDRLLSSFGGIENLTSIAFSGMSSAVASYGLHRIGNLYIFSIVATGGNYNIGTFDTSYLAIDDQAVATYISFPNSTVDKGGYLSITHSTGVIFLPLFVHSCYSEIAMISQTLPTPAQSLLTLPGFTWADYLTHCSGKIDEQSLKPMLAQMDKAIVQWLGKFMKFETQKGNTGPRVMVIQFPTYREIGAEYVDHNIECDDNTLSTYGNFFQQNANVSVNLLISVFGLPIFPFFNID
ncbi:MAG: hypothetical protein EZS28_007454 [Streblomastix strix]|uniref:Uncharacterized protein n=1 Tax=Streblomastix strix TaxID=222440 RepID=A0A5J4WQJ3_9EUKA|nr:MAG: hypothetical protein EZS28_007454 [Streblomastix strix]